MPNGDKFKQVEFEKIKECPFCSSGRIVFLFSSPERLTNLPGIFSVYRCLECGLVFQNPLLKEEYIGLYYTDRLGYYSPSADKLEKTDSSLKEFLINKTLVNHFKYDFSRKNFFLFPLTLLLKRPLKTRIFPDFKSNGKLLEVGCAYGTLLERMKRLGWNTVGIEMYKKIADFARERGLQVYHKRIEECNFAESEFDVVAMSMVLEHLYSPFKSLEKITRWLKKDGQLIFSIPYFDGFEFKWFKNYSFGLQLPLHIIFFNKKVLKQYLTALGYKDIKFYHQFFDRDVVASARHKYQETKSPFYKLIAYNKFLRFLVIKPLVLFASLFNQTSRITVYAQR